MIGLGNIFGLYLLALSWKWGQKLGKLSGINQVLVFWSVIEIMVRFPRPFARDGGLISQNSDLWRVS